MFAKSLYKYFIKLNLIRFWLFLNRKKQINVFFGDSVFLRTSKDDFKNQSLKKYFSNYSVNPSVKNLVFAHSAFNLRHYYATYEFLFKKNMVRGKTLIPINLRSFSPQWFHNSSWHYADYLHFCVSQKFDDYDFDISFAKNEFPLLDLKSAVLIKDYIDNIKPGKDLSEYHLRKKMLFAYHYLYELNENHPLLNHLNSFDSFPLRDVVFYIYPINHEAAFKYFGDSFYKVVCSNINIIRKLLNRIISVELIDFSFELSSDCFFHENSTTEHLNERGREILVQKIMKII